jgi:phosphoglycolate phosphatase
MAIVSNKYMNATRELAELYFKKIIPVAIGEKEGIRKKPAPDTVMEALRQLGESADNAVYVGDSDVDVHTARNSGMPCISCLWGFRDRDFLIKEGAETFVKDPSEIAELIESGAEIPIPG